MEEFTSPPLFDLLRHGKTEASDIFRGHIDDPLSEVGWQQMEQAVANQTWEQIICSPLSRCSNFATALAERLDISLQEDARFAEYNFGDWDGKRYSEVMEREAELVERFFDDPYSCTPPNAECFQDFHQRVVTAWNDTLSRCEGRSVLIVTHGGVIMSVIAEIMGLDRVHGRVDVGYANMTRIRPGSQGMTARLVSHRSLTN